jgi:hypothetical protein
VWAGRKGEKTHTVEACLGKEKHETRKNAGNRQQSRKGADRMNGRFRPEKYEKEIESRAKRGCGEEEGKAERQTRVWGGRETKFRKCGKL